MSKFRDQLNREWELKIDVPMLPKLRAVGLNLGEVVRDPKKLEALDDPEMLGRVLWVLVEVQAGARGIDPESFSAGFDGPTIFAAFEAFEEALVDFRQRPAVAKAIKERLPAAREKLDRKMLHELDKRLEAIPSGSNGTAGNSPGPSESSAPPG